MMDTILKILFFFCYCFCTTLKAVTTLSEIEVIQKALELNASINNSKIDFISDSLSYEQQRIKKLPQLSFSLSPKLTPHSKNSKTVQSVFEDTILSLNVDTVLKNLETSGSIIMQQDLPMGASMGLEYTQSLQTPLPAEFSSWESQIAFSVKQELLKDGIKYDKETYDLNIARLEKQGTTLSYKKTLIAELSNIRTLYWNYYLCQTMESITQQQLDYTIKQRKVAFDKYSVGDVAEIDTLSAALEELRLKQTLISSTYETFLARTDLATALQLPTDSILIPETINVVIDDLPEYQKLIIQTSTSDPEKQFLSVLREKLIAQLDQTRNNLLPSLAVKANYSINRNGDRFFSSNHLRQNNLVFELLFSYDIPSKSHKIEINKTKLQIQSNTISLKQQETKLTNTLLTFQQSWIREKAKIELSRASVSVSKKQLIAAEQGYELGSTDRLELLKAQNDLNQTQIEYIQSLIKMKLLEISIDEITGNVLDRFGVKF